MVSSRGLVAQTLNDVVFNNVYPIVARQDVMAEGQILHAERVVQPIITLSEPNTYGMSLT